MIRRTLFALLATGGLVGAGYLGWLHEIRRPVRPDAPAPQWLVISPGMSTAAIGRHLHALGLVRHPLVFRTLVAHRKLDGKLRSGEYLLEGTACLDEILSLLERGETRRRDLTFPEGKSLEDLASIAASRGLDGAAFLEAAGDPSPIQDLDPEAQDLEGYLFPDTYDLPRGDDAARALVLRMVRRFREVIGPELPRLPERGLTLRQLTTLASLVEMETARAEERPRIAAVFQNRLRRGMPLQTDPTVIYALRKAGGYDGNIRKKDLELASPYNTYRHPGLPPGPIASPGREALLAALDPAQAPDLYFVSRNDGSHQFSATLAEHERAVDRYQRRRRATPPRAS